MRNFLKKIIYIASVAKASSNILGSPFNVFYFLGYIIANDVIMEDLTERNVRIIDTDKNDSGILRLVDKDLVENFRDRNKLIVAIKVNFLRHSISVVKLKHAMGSCVDVQGNVPVCR